MQDFQQINSYPPAAVASSVHGQMGFPAQGVPWVVNHIKYNQRAALVLGIFQLIIGIFCCILNIILMCLYNPCFLSFVGYGIWSGAIFFIAGLLGILSGRNAPQKCLISSTNVMSIISACCAPVVFSLAVLGALIGGSRHSGYPYSSDSFIANIVTNGILAFLSLTELIVAIVSSTYCCKAYCCCSNNVQTAMAYNPATQHMMPVVVVHGTSFPVQTNQFPNQYPNQTMQFQNQQNQYPNKLNQNHPNQPIQFQNQPNQYPSQPNQYPNQSNQYPNQPNQYPNQHDQIPNQSDQIPNIPHENTTTPSNKERNDVYTPLQFQDYEKLNRD